MSLCLDGGGHHPRECALPFASHLRGRCALDPCPAHPHSAGWCHISRPWGHITTTRQGVSSHCKKIKPTHRRGLHNSLLAHSNNLIQNFTLCREPSLRFTRAVTVRRLMNAAALARQAFMVTDELLSNGRFLYQNVACGTKVRGNWDVFLLIVCDTAETHGNTTSQQEL